ncbi:MAG: hypothetical protein AD742_07735 [Methylibium sp. NZG]|nr:MAG: hypothetical protein AD742_07735 [Methylibium sp. NZG]
MRSSHARRRRAGKLAAVQAMFDQERLRREQLEAELHAQRARCFALEHELESRESDWAQSSPTPISFDAETFQVDRSPEPDAAGASLQADRIATLEGQVRDLQDLLSKVTSRARPLQARQRLAVELVDDVTPKLPQASS